MKKLILSLLFSIIFIFQSSFTFAEDIDVTKLTREQIVLLKEKADKGDAEAQTNLGVLYFNQGKHDLAEKYWKLANEQNFVDAQHHLGVLYYNQGKFDLVEKYWKMASEQGDKVCQLKLGYVYETQGKYELAKQYYKAAADNGSMIGTVLLNSLIKKGY